MSMHDSSKRQRLSDVGREGHHSKYEGGGRHSFDGGEHVHEPSLVVHVRGLPDGVVEGEIRAAVEGFGRIACVLLMGKKRQALVEFEDITSAINCVDYCSVNTLQIRNTSVYFNYSTSERIIRSPFENRQEEPTEINNVLLCTIMNATYPITCEVMHAITHNIAQPVRCVIFRKNGVQSMIEFATVEEAAQVRQQLNGADIYSGCCTLKIEFAKPKKLNVFKNENDVSWDWVTPNLDSGVSRYHSGSGLLPDPTQHGSPNFGGPVYGAYPTPSNAAYGLGGDMVQAGRPHTSHGYYPQAQTGYRSSRFGFRSGSHSGSSSDDQYPPASFHHRPPSATSGGRFSSGSRLPMQPGAVILIYGLAEKWNCDKLFSILCMYGNVIRIKFLKSKEGSAMVQLAEVGQVDNVIQALNSTNIYGGRLNIHHSRQMYIEEFGGRPASLADLTPAYKDFYKPPFIALQRFSTPESAAKNRLQPPSPVLHFFNAPPNVTEDQVVSLLTNSGGPPPQKMRMLQGKSDLLFPIGRGSVLPDQQGPRCYLDCLLKI